MIDRTRQELELYGEVCVVATQGLCYSNINLRIGGAPSKEYWLNEAKAVAVCQLSHTKRLAWYTTLKTQVNGGPLESVPRFAGHNCR